MSKNESQDMLLQKDVDKWMNMSSSEDTAKGFDDLLSRWRPEEVVSEIARTHWDDRAQVARRVVGAASLAYDRRPVETIATYCESLDNGGVQRVVSLLCPL